MTTSPAYRNKFRHSLKRLVVTIALVLFAGFAFGQTLVPANFYCANNEPSGDVFLLWDEPINPCGPFLGYVVYASNSPGGPYTALDTINPASNTTFTHVGADGNVVTWYYYIVALFDCPGATIPTSDTLDNLDPVFPELDYVTVNGGFVEVNWLPSVSPEAYAYIIYRQTTGFTPIDTVYGRFTTTYLDLGSSPGAQSEEYTIATMDSCRRLGVFSPVSQRTIFLEVLSQECDGLLMRWNEYENWATGVDSYEIWVGIDGGALALVETVDNTTFEYTWIDAPSGTDVCVVVRAIRGDGIFSSSNEVCLNTGGLSSALYAHFRIATISAPGETTLEWYPDNAADLFNWRMEVSQNGMDWTGITTQPFTAGVPPTITYVDENSTPGYWYRASTLDGCNDQLFSEPCRTIRLQANAGFDLTNSLKWNEPVIFGATITGYNIYRAEDDSTFTFLDAVAATELEYVDDVSTLLDGEGNLCYKVDAVYTLSLPNVGVVENHFTVSNEVCVEQFVRVYVPNAMVPGGTNTVFKPVILFDQEGTYEMEIFDRYGKVVFTSNNPDDGWDGRVNGEIVSGGAYAYVIRFLANNGREVIKKGSFLVVR